MVILLRWSVLLTTAVALSILFFSLLYLIFPLKVKAQVASTAPDENFCIVVPVLFYHHIEPIIKAKKEGHEIFTVDLEIFESQLEYLSDSGYRTVSLDELISVLEERHHLSKNTVILTFDDGYEDIYRFVYPLLRKYGMVGNMAISTKLINTPGYMNWNQIIFMQQNGNMFFYNHTSTHPMTERLTKQQLLSEVASAHHTLLALVNTTPIFIYPYGTVTPDLLTVLAEQGFTAGFTTRQGTMHCTKSIMTLPRLRIGNVPLTTYGL